MYMIAKSILEHLEKMFHEQYELSATIRHRGERGRQRENGLLIFLRDNLPGAYGVATGEIIPYKSSMVSPQCDIIIYDYLHMPIFGRSKTVQQIPLEAVYAVIECKSIINVAALKDAENKNRKIQELPRCTSINITAGKDGEEKLAGPLFYLFGYKMKTEKKKCAEFTQRTDIKIVALDAGITIRVENIEGGNPTWLNCTEKDSECYETLAVFYVDLLFELQHTKLGNPNFVKMIFLEDLMK